jgi:putative addiction module component (TIGR02574 family)
MPVTVDIATMTTVERLGLIEQLWDSLSNDAEDLPLTSEQAAELDRRLALQEADPSRNAHWDIVKAKIRQQI